MPKVPYTSKVLVEVEISHWGTPHSAVDSCVVFRLTGPAIPAIINCKILSIKSNYKLHGEPTEEMRQCNIA